MCSICGIFKFNSSSNFDLNKINKMNNLMTHRGPDFSNIIIEKNFSLGSNRLAIVDAENSKSNQPFIKNNIYVVFNGEIYNYKKLKNNLIKTKSINFITNSDTEVILELYKIYGINFVNFIEGMFSICIFDNVKKIGYLIRDRLGEKPLFYYHSKNELLFSSELKSLKITFENFFDINFDSLEHYFKLNYILTNKCIFNKIKKLEPGNYIEFNFDNHFKIYEYWKLEEFFENKNKFNFDEFDELIKNKLNITSKYDKKIGTFLSGGLDSGYLTSIISKFNPNNISTTYKFQNKFFDESIQASFTASYLNIENKNTSDINHHHADDLLKIVYSLDEPMSDTSILPFYQLCGFSKKFSKVFISGDGGDEIFLGYETYIADKLNIDFHYLKPLLNIFKFLFKSPIEQEKKISSYFKFSRLIENMSSNFVHSHHKWRKIFDNNNLHNLISKDYYNLINNDDSYLKFKNTFNKVNTNDLLNKFSFLDIKTWLVDDILVKADRLSMSHGLEVRSPFLNHKIVEYLASISSSEKINYFNKKKILKKLINKDLPNSIIKRRKKGFNSPVAKLLNNDLKILVNDYFNSNNAKKLFNKKIIDNLLKNHQMMYEDNHLKIFNILIILIYFDNYNVKI